MTPSLEQSSLQPGPSRGRKLIVTSIKVALLCALLAFVFIAIRRELVKVDDWSVFRPDFKWIVLSVLAWLGVCSVQIISYRHLLKCYGQRPTWPQMMSIAWIPPLGKYVPGKIAALGGAMYMLRQFGVAAAIAISVVLMMDAFAALLGLMIGSRLLMIEPIASRVPGGGFLALGVFVLGCIVLYPAVFSRVLNLGLRLVKRPALDQLPGLVDYILPIICGLFQWLFAGLALWCIGRSIAWIDPELIIDFIVIQACAMTIGYLALIAPGGFGVTEAIRLIALGPLIPDAPVGTVAIVVIAMRLMQMGIEVGLAGIGALIYLRISRSKA